MTAVISVASDHTALSPGQLKAEIIRIRQGFDRPLPTR